MFEMYELRRGAAGLISVLALGGVVGCGGDGGTSERDQAEAIRAARADARREARAEAKAEKAADETKRLAKQVEELKRGGGSTTANSGSRPAPSASASAGASTTGSVSCGNGLSVNSVTTCPFAENVRGEYGSNPGARSISAFSPALGKRIIMTCSPGVTTICRGGANAVVYIR